MIMFYLHIHCEEHHACVHPEDSGMSDLPPRVMSIGNSRSLGRSSKTDIWVPVTLAFRSFENLAGGWED